MAIAAVSALLLPCRALAAENENYGALSKQCGEQGFHSMMLKYLEANRGAMLIHGQKVKVPWNGKTCSANVLVEAAILVGSSSEFEETDLIKALNSNNGYWRVVGLGVIWGHAKSKPSKSYHYVEAANRFPSDSELTEILHVWRKSNEPQGLSSP